MAIARKQALALHQVPQPDGVVVAARQRTSRKAAIGRDARYLVCMTQECLDWRAEVAAVGVVVIVVVEAIGAAAPTVATDVPDLERAVFARRDRDVVAWRWRVVGRWDVSSG